MTLYKTGHRRLRTSDRSLFKRCRRKFALESETMYHLEPLGASPVQFWLGTGVHFALEDFHGYKKFATPHDAFEAYTLATLGSKNLMTDDFAANYELGKGMLTNYINWVPQLRGFETLWVDGVPMCEVRLIIPMPEIGEGVEYSATIDRLLQDEHGRIWMLDYKTAKSVNTEKLPLDQQITAYYWAVKKQYGLELEGMIYIQLLKQVPDEPTVLKNGSLSKAKNQSTSYQLYVKKLKEIYNGRLPGEYKEILDQLKSEAGFLDNKYIKVDFVRRNEHQIAAEEKKIIAEGRDIFNPATVMYPNPTKDCSWDCRFKQVCIGMDDGSDYRQILRDNFRRQQPEDDSWRVRIDWPGRHSGVGGDDAIAEEMLR